MQNWSRDQLAAVIDHSVLRPDATREDVLRACEEAGELGFRTVCVATVWVAEAAAAMPRGGQVAAVVGFPHGNTLPEIKALEATRALEAGAKELDMVLQVGALKSGDASLVLRDIEGVVEAAAEHGALVKVILETGLLTDSEKLLACKIAEKAGAHFVKTSTGFGSGGATEADVSLLRRAVRNRLGVKASGGIRTLAQALVMLNAGATRIGTSASVAILAELAAGEPH